MSKALLSLVMFTQCAINAENVITLKDGTTVEYEKAEVTFDSIMLFQKTGIRRVNWKEIDHDEAPKEISQQIRERLIHNLKEAQTSHEQGKLIEAANKFQNALPYLTLLQRDALQKPYAQHVKEKAEGRFLWRDQWVTFNERKQIIYREQEKARQQQKKEQEEARQQQKKEQEEKRLIEIAKAKEKERKRIETMPVLLDYQAPGVAKQIENALALSKDRFPGFDEVLLSSRIRQWEKDEFKRHEETQEKPVAFKGIFTKQLKVIQVTVGEIIIHQDFCKAPKVLYDFETELLSIKFIPELSVRAVKLSAWWKSINENNCLGRIIVSIPLDPSHAKAIKYNYEIIEFVFTVEDYKITKERFIEDINIDIPVYDINARILSLKIKGTPGLRNNRTPRIDKVKEARRKEKSEMKRLRKAKASAGKNEAEPSIIKQPDQSVAVDNTNSLPRTDKGQNVTNQETREGTPEPQNDSPQRTDETLVLWLKAERDGIKEIDNRVLSWLDKSGKGNHFTQPKQTHQPVFVGASKDRRGLEFPSIRFDGDQFLDGGNNPTFSLRNQVTIAAWFKPKPTNTTVALLNKTGDIAGDRAFSFGMYGVKYPWKFGFSLAANEYRNIWGKWQPTDVWTQAAGTYDGVQATLYIDGKRLERTSLQGQIKNAVTTLKLGRNGFANPTPNFFYGWIHEIRIYNRALSDAEISDLAER